MKFACSREHDELRKTVRSFLESTSAPAEVQQLLETTEVYDTAVWKQLGLHGLAILQGYGGSRRATPSELFVGGPTCHRELLAQRTGM